MQVLLGKQQKDLVLAMVQSCKSGTLCCITLAHAGVCNTCYQSTALLTSQSLMVITAALPDYLHVWLAKENPYAQKLLDQEALGALQRSKQAFQRLSQPTKFMGVVKLHTLHWRADTRAFMIRQPAASCSTDMVSRQLC